MHGRRSIRLARRVARRAGYGGCEHALDVEIERTAFAGEARAEIAQLKQDVAELRSRSASLDRTRAAVLGAIAVAVFLIQIAIAAFVRPHWLP